MTDRNPAPVHPVEPAGAPLIKGELTFRIKPITASGVQSGALLTEDLLRVLGREGFAEKPDSPVTGVRLNICT